MPLFFTSTVSYRKPLSIAFREDVSVIATPAVLFTLLLNFCSFTAKYKYKLLLEVCIFLKESTKFLVPVKVPIKFVLLFVEVSLTVEEILAESYCNKESDSFQ